MRLTNEELKELYQQDTTRSERGQAECPPKELMVRAAAGELDTSERGQVADHVMTCSDCAREYRSLRTLVSWSGAAAATVSETPGERKFDAVPSRSQRAQVTGGGQLGFRQQLSDLFFASRASYAVAAVLLLFSVALVAALILQRRENQRLVAQLNEQPSQRVPVTATPSTETPEAMRRQLEEANRRAEREAAARVAAQEELARRLTEGNVKQGPNRTPARSDREVAELRSSVNSLSQPQVNVPIIDVDPQGSTRAQSSGGVTTIEVPSGANLFTLILNVTGQPSYSSFALEISKQGGAVVWRGGGLQKSPYNNFTVALPRRSFPAGRYRIKLYGLRDGQKEPVEEYLVSVQYR